MIHINRKITAAVVVLLLACTPMVTAFASSPNGHNAAITDQQNGAGNNGQKNGSNGGNNSQNTDKQNGQAYNGNQQKDKTTGNSNSQSDNKNADPSGSSKDNANINNEMNISAIQAAIAALSDQDSKTTLTALLATYQTALDTLQALDKTADAAALKAARDALQSAKNALLSALSTAGIKPAAIKGNGAENKAGQNAHGQLNTTALKAAIDGISDETVQTSLLALYTTYQTALDALKNAQNNNADAAAIKSARDALNTAQTDLLRALYSAGVKIATVLGNDTEKDQNPGKQLDVDAIKTAIAALSDQATQTSLLGLLTTYQTALDKLKIDLDSKADANTITADMNAITAAKSTLLTALSAAGIQPAIGKGEEDPDVHNHLDIEAIQTAIAALSDTTVKTSLLALVTTYQSALDNLKTDLDNSVVTDTITADRLALGSAKTALLAALSTAGVVLPSASPSTSPSAGATTQIQTQQNPGGLWAAIVNWFTGMFEKK
ncbi:MAG: hypothetical protein WCP73_03585 [Eubacteriales bacterium]